MNFGRRILYCALNRLSEYPSSTSTFNTTASRLALFHLSFLAGRVPTQSLKRYLDRVETIIKNKIKK